MKFSSIEVNEKILFRLSESGFLNTAKYFAKSMSLLRKRKKYLTSGSFQKILGKSYCMLYFAYRERQIPIFFSEFALILDIIIASLKIRQNCIEIYSFFFLICLFQFPCL